MEKSRRLLLISIWCVVLLATGCVSHWEEHGPTIGEIQEGKTHTTSVYLPDGSVGQLYSREVSTYGSPNGSSIVQAIGGGLWGSKATLFEIQETINQSLLNLPANDLLLRVYKNDRPNSDPRQSISYKYFLYRLHLISIEPIAVLLVPFHDKDADLIFAGHLDSSYVSCAPDAITNTSVKTYCQHYKTHVSLSPWQECRIFNKPLAEYRAIEDSCSSLLAKEANLLKSTKYNVPNIIVVPGLLNPVTYYNPRPIVVRAGMLVLLPESNPPQLLPIPEQFDRYAIPNVPHFFLKNDGATLQIERGKR